MSGANTKSVLARFCDNNLEKGKYFVKTFFVKNLCGRGRGARARAGWRVWDLGNGTIMLRKANGDKTLQKSLKFSACRKSTRKQIRPSCRKTFRPHFVFVWFSWKHRNLEIRANIRSALKMFWQRVAFLVKFYTDPKIFCWARKRLGTSLALQCYAGFVSSGFPNKIA